MQSRDSCFVRLTVSPAQMALDKQLCCRMRIFAGCDMDLWPPYGGGYHKFVLRVSLWQCQVPVSFTLYICPEGLAQALSYPAFA